MGDQPLSEVKGVWFAAARDYLREAQTSEALRRLAAGIPLAYRQTYAQPMASSWYSEQALEVGLMVLYDQVAQRNDQVFEQIIEGCTAKGIRRLFRMLLRSNSPSFLLRRVPSMWRQVRRGAGHVEVSQERGASEVQFSEFPWFDNALYRMMTVASLRALVRCCTGETPELTIVLTRPDRLHLHVAYHARENIKPAVRFASTRPSDTSGSSFPPPRPSGSSR